MVSEELIQNILLRHPEVNREEILESLKAEKEKTGGLISDDSLLRLIAARYGIKNIQFRTIYRLSIGDLVTGLNDVTIAGRIVVIYPPRTFNSDRSGKVANLIITDKDHVIKVVLWNDNVNLIESGELKVGQIIRLSHGYTREGYEGKVELHMGNKSQVEINPEDAEGNEYPAYCKLATKIKEINGTQNSIHLAGIVQEISSLSTFERSDKSTGTVMRLKIADETGEISVVVWNEKIEELEEIVKVNMGLQLVNARVKENRFGELEVHVNSHTHVEVSDCLDF